jgi:hypothetical protein
LPHRPLPCKSVKTTGCKMLPNYSFALGRCFSNYCYALSCAHGNHCFN